MAELKTEEEQLEALKRWWDENGKALLTGVLLAVVGILGWKWWQNHQLEQREAASMLYQDMSQLTLAQEPLNEEDRSTAEHLSSQLKDEFPESLYARYAALSMAKVAVQAGAFEQAEQELRWALAQSPEDHPLRPIINLRLARVLQAQGNIDAALTLLETTESGTHTVAYEEKKGDLYLAQGETDKAQAAYEAAIAALGGQQRPLLQMKLDNLATGQS